MFSKYVYGVSLDDCYDIIYVPSPEMWRVTERGQGSVLKPNHSTNRLTTIRLLTNNVIPWYDCANYHDMPQWENYHGIKTTMTCHHCKVMSWYTMVLGPW